MAVVVADYCERRRKKILVWSLAREEEGDWLSCLGANYHAGLAINPSTSRASRRGVTMYGYWLPVRGETKGSGRTWGSQVANRKSGSDCGHLPAARWDRRTPLVRIYYVRSGCGCGRGMLDSRSTLSFPREECQENENASRIRIYGTSRAQAVNGPVALVGAGPRFWRCGGSGVVCGVAGILVGDRGRPLTRVT